ncbi:hypothetical protein TBLA_0I01280 [Henningerozyma blattae CBS 6284]|uniref:Uncharacterized protein n=1 Tax=Henningerozyma blattae (strain ATCC 34711 / CBS 6284 / DSM 70876 / NBRC 10599 / NRRL Y-10934 / UCD 77-7) TaxID=1071380 RepID=I2H8T6_HENB6|nr:hypothetical protein TBLA_0I01280 [Tetrapisispora blattae CBS 6284]CCH62788.1 hypothetical protein TBLA_0I01280 [Tetrapisispora blattae CBS 6284]
MTNYYEYEHPIINKYLASSNGFENENSNRSLHEDQLETNINNKNSNNINQNSDSNIENIDINNANNNDDDIIDNVHLRKNEPGRKFPTLESWYRAVNDYEFQARCPIILKNSHKNKHFTFACHLKSCPFKILVSYSGVNNDAFDNSNETNANITKEDVDFIDRVDHTNSSINTPTSSNILNNNDDVTTDGNHPNDKFTDENPHGALLTLNDNNSPERVDNQNTVKGHTTDKHNGNSDSITTNNDDTIGNSLKKDASENNDETSTKHYADIPDVDDSVTAAFAAAVVAAVDGNNSNGINHDNNSSTDINSPPNNNNNNNNTHNIDGSRAVPVSAEAKKNSIRDSNLTDNLVTFDHRDTHMGPFVVTKIEPYHSHPLESNLSLAKFVLTKIPRILQNDLNFDETLEDLCSLNNEATILKFRVSQYVENSGILDILRQRYGLTIHDLDKKLISSISRKVTTYKARFVLKKKKSGEYGKNPQKRNSNIEIPMVNSSANKSSLTTHPNLHIQNSTPASIAATLHNGKSKFPNTSPSSASTISSNSRATSSVTDNNVGLKAININDNSNELSDDSKPLKSEYPLEIPGSHDTSFDKSHSRYHSNRTTDTNSIEHTHKQRNNQQEQLQQNRNKLLKSAIQNINAQKELDTDATQLQATAQAAMNDVSNMKQTIANYIVQQNSNRHSLDEYMAGNNNNGSHNENHDHNISRNAESIDNQSQPPFKKMRIDSNESYTSSIEQLTTHQSFSGHDNDNDNNNNDNSNDNGNDKHLNIHNNSNSINKIEQKNDLLKLNINSLIPDDNVLESLDDVTGDRLPNNIAEQLKLLSSHYKDVEINQHNNSLSSLGTTANSHQLPITSNRGKSDAMNENDDHDMEQEIMDLRGVPVHNDESHVSGLDLSHHMDSPENGDNIDVDINDEADVHSDENIQPELRNE